MPFRIVEGQAPGLRRPLSLPEWIGYFVTQPNYYAAQNCRISSKWNQPVTEPRPQEAVHVWH